MNTIFAVYRNSDMTEGRGPMIIDSLWSDLQEAKKYIDIQPGIQGRMAKWSTMKHGDWYIEELKVYNTSDQKNKEDNEIIRVRALNKLTDKERKVLGL